MTHTLQVPTGPARAWLPLTALLLLPLLLRPAPAAGLLPNASFEGEIRPNGVPAGWSTYVPEGDATIRVETAGARDGRRCVLVETPSDLKATLVSDPAPVAPGEKLTLSVWVRAEHLTTQSAGSLTFNAAFLDAGKHYFRWHKAQPAPPQPGEWVRLTTEAVAPPGAAYATFQVGIARMSGRTWWDGAEFQGAPIALRIDLPGSGLGPGRQQVPVTIINRDPKLAGSTLELRAGADGDPLRHQLAAGIEQPVAMPVTLRKRGRQTLKLSAVDATGRVLATASVDTTIPPLLVTEPLVPTHWCVEDGPARPEARLWVHEEEAARAKLTLRCTLERDGTVLSEQKISPLPPNPVHVEFAPLNVEPGACTVRYTLSTSGKQVASDTLPWQMIHRAAARVELSAGGFPVVDGKPVFPIGMFNGGRFAEQSAAGFNVTHSYNASATRPGVVPDNLRLARFLDETHAAGMKALVLLTHGSHARPVDAEVVRRARMFRNHPGLLAWDEEEGIARGEAPLALARDLHAMIAREDPNHPLMIGDTRDVVFKVKDRSELFPAEHMDLGMWWWYPFPLAPSGRPVLLEGEEVTTTDELVPPSFLTLAKTRKPLWVGLQAYRKPERADGRFPTPVEYRAQAYLAVIHGARGLMYYVGSGSGGNGILNKPEEGHWEALKKLVTELRSMEDVFLAPDAPGGPRVVPDAAKISTRLKQLGGLRVLLAANRSGSPIDATFTLAGSRDAAVTVRFENRTVSMKGHQFTDRFDPYAVHVYELPQEEPR